MYRLRVLGLAVALAATATQSGCSMLAEDAESSAGAVSSGPSAIADLKKATRVLTDAQKAVGADKERARTEMERIGPALTGDQLAAFGTAFQKQKSIADHAAASAKAAEALETLITGDASNKEVLETLAAGGSDAARALYAAHLALAASASSKSTLAFAVSVMANPTSALSKRILAVGDAKTIEEKLFARALPTVAVVDLAKTNDIDQTIRNVEELLAPLAKSSATAEIATKVDELLEVIVERDLDKVADLASANDRAGVQALVASAISLHLLDAKDDSRAVEIARTLSKIAATSISVVAHTTQSFADVAFFAHHSITSATSTLQLTSAELTMLAHRLVPGLGLLAAGMSLVLDAQRAQNATGGAAEFAAVLAVVGDALAIAGCIVQLSVVGAPAGWVLRAVAIAVTFVAHLIAAWAENQAFVAEETGCLVAIGFDRKLAETIAKAQPRQLAALGGPDLGFSGEAIQWMATNSPSIVTRGADGGSALDGLAALESAARLTPEDALSFLQASIANVDGEDRPDALGSLVTILHGALLGAPRPRTADDFVTYLTAFADGDVAAHDPATKQEVTDAAAWLRARPSP